MSFVIKLKWFFKERWKSYVLAITVMTIVTLLTMIPPIMIGKTVDEIREGQLTSESLTQTVLLLVVLGILLYILVYIWIMSLFRNSALIESILRKKLLTKLTKMTPSFFHRNTTGDLMALATNDVLAIGQTAGFGVMTLVNTIVGVSVVVVMMVFLISYKLMLAAFIPLPFLALVINKLGKNVRVNFLGAQASFGKMNDQALESISGMRVIRSYVQEEDDISAFDKVTTEVLDKNRKVAIFNALFQPSISLIVGLSVAIGISYGSYLVYQNEITLGELITFNIFLGMLIWPMIAFGEFINVLQRGSASADRMENVLLQESDVKNAEEITKVGAPTSIEMKNLTFKYPGSNTTSLERLSFRLEQGQTLGIVGRTGSGKSTLLKQLLRQYPIDKERLFISDIPVEQISLEKMKGWISYVPQEHMLLSKTLKENIKLGKPDATQEEIDRAVKMASFTKDVARMTDGLETLIGEQGVMLSGGQKQRVAIARALLLDAEVLILDDSLSAVDAKTENKILHEIRSERAGKTTLITSHRLSAVSHADWILVMDEGRVIAEGTHEELMFHGGWYKEQWEHQQMEASLD
ncbi:ABC transporter ATP-binding protein [Chengkuizengella axinellae]|uniref:ABC transporter transmembrane domain-containing protein n=1 Tax=Chengkuizengella axinellae TaxID=3064388 RepID=A0ABT9J4A8_9BACL|nr:ABC transporter transmembrane domain-containing protein [Chengkuizengella sp. 2205SS18-9]MDP5276426.1 ABC transporter transmembrane domain-containing protein [Chengkuizengella sp. 2205SS18-9]